MIGIRAGERTMNDHEIHEHHEHAAQHHKIPNWLPSSENRGDFTLPTLQQMMRLDALPVS